MTVCQSRCIMSEKLEKRLEKRKKIIETGFALFKKNTVAATAIDDVVKAAGIARGTFYLYFRDKNDLLEQIIMHKSAENMRIILNNFLLEAENTQLTLRDFITSFLRHYFDFMESNKDILAIVQKNTSSFLRFVKEIPDTEIRDIYNRIIKKMEIFGFTLENANKAIYIVAEMVGSICADAVLVGKPYTLEEIKPSVLDASVAVLESFI